MAWLPLPSSLSNGQVLKYKIEYGLGKEGEWGRYRDVSGNGGPPLDEGRCQWKWSLIGAWDEKALEKSIGRLDSPMCKVCVQAQRPEFNLRLHVKKKKSLAQW